MPHEDTDAAMLIEHAFRSRGIEILPNARADHVDPHASGVVVTLTDGRTVEGTHALAAVGLSQADVEAGEGPTRQVMLPLAGNARAKMGSLDLGFVKLFCRQGSGRLLGGVVVAPRASELIFPIALAVELGLALDQVAHTATIDPSLSGSIAEAARQLMLDELE